MDEIDYKQVAQNILKLLDDNVENTSIKSYIGLVIGKPILWKTMHNYHTLCKIMKYLGLQEPSEDEWKKR